MSDQQPPGGPQPWDAQQPSAMQPYQQQPYQQQPYQQPYAGQPGGYGPDYGYAYPPAAGPVAYGVDPYTGVAWSDKNRTTAGLLQLLLSLVGVCGVGRLYAGQVGIGLAQLLGFIVGCVLMVVLIGFVIAPAIWIWAVVDGIVLLSSGGRDQYGRQLR